MKNTMVFLVFVCTVRVALPALGGKKQDVSIKNAENFGRTIGTLEACGHKLAVSKKAIIFTIEYAGYKESRTEELKQTFEISWMAQQIAVLAGEDREEICRTILEYIQERSDAFLDLIKAEISDQTPKDLGSATSE